MVGRATPIRFAAKRLIEWPDGFVGVSMIASTAGAGPSGAYPSDAPTSDTTSSGPLPEVAGVNGGNSGQPTKAVTFNTTIETAKGPINVQVNTQRFVDPNLVESDAYDVEINVAPNANSSAGMKTELSEAFQAGNDKGSGVSIYENPDGSFKIKFRGGGLSHLNRFELPTSNDVELAAKSSTLSAQDTEVAVQAWNRFLEWLWSSGTSL